MPRIIITVPDKDPQPYRFQLDRSKVSIGRGSDNDIVIDCGSISGKHARMVRVPGGYELHDADSTNGVKLDGARTKVITLEPGINARLGDVLFDFSLTEEELAVLAEEALAPIIKEPALARPPAKRAEPQEEYKPPTRQKAFKPEKSSGMGLGSILVFFVFIAVAFCGGLFIRHEKDTGESLFTAIGNKWSSQATAALEKDPSKEDPEE